MDGEIRLDGAGERSLAEFPDDDAWERLKAEIGAQYTPEDAEGGGADGDRR